VNCSAQIVLDLEHQDFLTMSFKAAPFFFSDLVIAKYLLLSSDICYGVGNRFQIIWRLANGLSLTCQGGVYLVPWQY